ncbi:transient receptor potential cation channel subfamily A member 1 homolog isoform X1 [Haliotis rufescens]|uniref:transient receptor potential cation channel subfamily A member 1 homolog isoform X1 n=1 Tax=Haliotis rufescens TaxID=6454 RepID=UPI00201F025E|nr:transient receptor potential cation channel subfamily A member 1 homolog isoform X1 [Haliotis rufescens]XP_046335738.2 transient receptor potential cation channel subfamily A member 1 homolog isoform X1 [Haliotis rufescens]
MELEPVTSQSPKRPIPGGGLATEEPDMDSDSSMGSPKLHKHLKRFSTVTGALAAFEYKLPGRQTRLDCTLTSLVSSERITQELVQCAREGDASTLEAIINALGKNVEKHVNSQDENSLTPLHYAAQYNHPDVVDILLKNKADVNIRGEEEGVCPAHYAAMPVRGKKLKTDRSAPKSMDQVWSGSSCVPKLKENGADFTMKDTYGQTPLHYAAIHGNVVAARDILAFQDINIIESEDNQNMRALHVAALYDELGVAKLLLNAGAEIRCMDHETSTPLHHACSSGNLPLVKMLFEIAEKNPEKNVTELLVKDQDVEGSTCLHLAVENGHSEITHLCVQKGANVNQSRSDGLFPLHLAVVSGKIDIIRHLVDKGAIIDASNDMQTTPLHKAAQFNRVRAARLLLRRGANIECLDKDNDTPLLIAAMYGHVETVEMLVKKGADVDATNLKEKTAVYVAAEEGNLSVLQSLLSVPEMRNLINWGDRDGNTALHIAAQKKNLHVVKILLKNKASIHTKNELEESPLHMAAKYGNVNTIREIVRNGQNSIFAEDEKSNTPLHLAALYGHTLSVGALIELGADVSQKNCVLWTALDMAAAQGWNNTCKVLLEADAPVDPTDKRNTTPLHLACSSGHREVVQLLLRWNASVTKRDMNGMNCLDLAIENNKSDIARQIIQSDKWKDALRHAHIRKKRGNVTIDTPLRRLIRKMPDVAKEVFDRCITAGEEQDPTDENFEQRYNFEFIDDLYAEWAQPPSNEGGTSQTESKISYRRFGKLMPYSHRSKTIKENHPLHIMVSAHQEQLLAHPLVTSLISHKWWSFGAWFHLYSFFLHLMFIIFLTMFTLNTTPPHQYSTALADAIKGGSCDAISSDYHQPVNTNNQKYVVIFLVIVCIFNELFQMYQSKLSYFSVNNVTEWIAYIFTILVLVDFNHCQTLTGYRLDWQWSLAALAVFLSWTDLMFFVQGFSSLGIYVVMFRDILVTFLKAITVFFVLILAFAIAFVVLLRNQIPFRDIGSSLMKTFVMIIGEYDFNDIFNAGVLSTASVDGLYYPAATSILFVGFVVLSSIVLMNLLVGLAVDDIKGILRQAALKRMAMQVELTLDVEKILPDLFRQRFFRPTKIIKPNLESKYPLRHVVAAFTNWWTTDAGEDEDIVLKDIPEIRNTQIKIQKEVKAIRKVVNVVHDMHLQNKRIESMLRAIVKNSDTISWVEEDYSSDEDRTLTQTMGRI